MFCCHERNKFKNKYIVSLNVFTAEMHQRENLWISHVLQRSQMTSSKRVSVWCVLFILEHAARLILDFWGRCWCQYYRAKKFRYQNIGHYSLFYSFIKTPFLQCSLKCGYQTFVTNICNRGRIFDSLTLNFIITNESSCTEQ